MQPNDRLSEFFTYGELIRSDSADRLGIDNAPNDMILAQLQRTAQKMDGIRRMLGHPIYVSSGFRSVPLNVAVGGVANSQHCEGKAIDFTCPNVGLVTDIFNRIRNAGIEYDQLIREYHKTPGGGWVHISFVDSGWRRQAFDLP